MITCLLPLFLFLLPGLERKREMKRKRKCGGEVGAELQHWQEGGAETDISLGKQRKCLGCCLQQPKILDQPWNNTSFHNTSHKSMFAPVSFCSFVLKIKHNPAAQTSIQLLHATQQGEKAYSREKWNKWAVAYILSGPLHSIHRG